MMNTRIQIVELSYQLTMGQQGELTMMSPPPSPSNVADATNFGSIVSLAWIWAIRGL